METLFSSENNIKSEVNKCLIQEMLRLSHQWLQEGETKKPKRAEIYKFQDWKSILSGKRLGRIVAYTLYSDGSLVRIDSSRQGKTARNFRVVDLSAENQTKYSSQWFVIQKPNEPERSVAIMEIFSNMPQRFLQGESAGETIGEPLALLFPQELFDGKVFKRKIEIALQNIKQ